MYFSNMIRNTAGVLLILLVFSCSRNEPIKIGMVAGLSGRMSQLGVSARNAVLVAVEKANEEGGIHGRKIELIIKDNQGDPEICGRVIQELIDQGVVGIIGPLMSKMADTVLDTIKGKEVLVISPTISTDAIKDIDDNFIRLMPVASQEALAMADVVIREGHKQVAVVYDASNRAYTGPIYELFRQRLERGGGKVTYVNDMSDTREKKFTKMAREIISADVQALYIISSGIDASFLCQQIRRVTSGIRFYGSNWVKTGKIIEQGGRSVEGMVIAAPYEQEPKTSQFQEFSFRHKELFNADPDFVATYSHEAAQVLFFGIRKNRTFSPRNIKQTILDQKKFQGLEEPFIINNFGDAIRSAMFLEIKNGAFIRRD